VDDLAQDDLRQNDLPQDHPNAETPMDGSPGASAWGVKLEGGEVVRSRPRRWARDARSLARFFLRDRSRSRRLVPFLPDRVDLIHFNGPMHDRYDWAHLAFRLKVPLLTRENGVWRRPPLAYKRVAGRAASIVCLTEERRDKIHDFCGPGVHTDLVPNGVDLSRLTPRRTRSEVRDELGLDPETPLLITAGHIQAWKGQALGIAAAASLVSQGRNLRWIFCGRELEPEYARALCRQITESKLESTVSLLGERSDLPDLFAASDLAVHTAVQPAPFDNVVIEAMASGTTVVGPNEGANPGVIRPDVDGLLYTPRDATALAGALAKMIDDPERCRAMGQEARARVAGEFTLEKMVERHCAIYERVLGTPRG
jgi:glycosyltransferase involved in cell wall biosynthesis